MGVEDVKKKLKNQILFQYLRENKIKKKDRKGLRKKDGGGGG